MRKWALKAGQPLSLTLAADARLGATDYYDDQIWELSLDKGEPPALAVTTTYGLRVRTMRMFPLFGEGNATVSDPAAFKALPVIEAFYPNFYRVAFSPLADLEVSAEYWLPESHAIAGQLWLTNNSNRPRQIEVAWAAVLTPISGGERTTAALLAGRHVLSGRSASLSPLVLVAGNCEPVAGPYPALGQTFELQPLASQTFRWVQAACSTPEESLALAEKILALPWEAEIARLELINSRAIEIHTGDADWDAVLAHSQKTALGLLVGPTAHLPAVSFVSSRLPDQGFSLRGDGLDYAQSWSGQTGLEALFLFDYLLPAYPDLAKGIVQNFIAARSPTGEVDCKPGLGGQRAQLAATPLLASLAWKIYTFTHDEPFLKDIFPHLLATIQSWFTPEHDRDGDGVPEWDHPLQTGFDDHPLFAHWQTLAQGVDITTVECPDLCAYLFRECQLILKIGELLGQKEPLPAVATFADHLRTAVEATWDEDSASYRYCDRDSHLTPAAQPVCRLKGEGDLLLDTIWDKPARLLITANSTMGAASKPQLFIHGVASNDQHLIERVPPERFRWQGELGRATTERLFTAVEKVSVQGIQADDELAISSVDLTVNDQTTLLPLWAGIPTAARARQLVKSITNTRRFWRPFGLRAVAQASASPDDNSPFDFVHVIWNSLIGEGLLRYNQRAKAAELVKRVMTALISDGRQSHAFHRAYHAESGQGKGERNALAGLAPIGLFLDALGVQIISPTHVVIEGFNPFPWPVTVKYCGLTLLRQKRKTTIIFPDGQTVTFSNPKRQSVRLV